MILAGFLLVVYKCPIFLQEHINTDLAHKREAFQKRSTITKGLLRYMLHNCVQQLSSLSSIVTKSYIPPFNMGGGGWVLVMIILNGDGCLHTP